MAIGNDLYAKAAEAMLRGEVDWEDDAFVCLYLEATYTADLALHEFRSSIPGGSVIGSEALTSTAILANGVADADDVTGIVVPVGKTVAAVVIYQDNGSAGADRLIAYMDEAEDFTPIGVPGTGAAIPCLWSASASRVFQI